ncbi:macrophage mannose receptor 1-like [Rhineura floridana]|uniref:macrophage mannose receptor 1-like n=1 Tax=Rhineura floridana TaxID=261503 RepID=UPI002AC8427F|nr:macrophage mannose receptor 1-like [Rhineura floridana]
MSAFLLLRLLLFIQLAFQVSDGIKPIKCLDGWTAYAGYCYRLNRDSKTWKGALLSCRREDGDLISIHNLEEYSFVISQLGYKPTDLLWIGLNDQKTPMYYEWSDGTTVRFTTWQQGKPAHIKDVQNDCVIMNGESGYWSDYFCEEELGYICKRQPLASLPEEPETADPNCQKGWKRYGFYCYLIGQTSVTFSEATTFCETKKGSLTSVENRYEQAYLTSLVGLRSEKYFWIGLSDVKQPGTFNWTNGDSVLFTHWNSRMPGHNPGCVAMRTGAAAGLWDVVSCEEKAPFICKQWAEGVTTTPAPKTTPPPPCPEGWHPSSTRTVCFKAYVKDKQNKKSWFEARDFCRAIGGDLASVHSQEEQLLIKNIVSADHWIGLNELETNKSFTWSDGSPVDFLDTSFPFNDHRDKEQGCRGVSVYYRWWRPSWCQSFLNWICQIKRGVSLKPEPRNSFEYSFKRIEDGWIAYKGNEYYLSSETLSAERARAFCKKHSGDLIVIESESERLFWWKYNKFYGSSQDIYIGLILGLDRKFGWLDGTPVTYVAWAPNEPNFANDDENCVVVYTNTGLWNDINCGAEKKFICERHNSSVRSTVAPTSPAPLGGCDDGWLFFDNKCFQLFGFNEGDRKNWSDARTACRKLGGNLATISSKAIQAFLTMHLKSISTHPWIGLNDINIEHQFVWTDGSGVYYTNWAKGFPRYGEDCIFLMKNPEKLAGMWKDGPCSTEKSYICQKNADPGFSHSETTIPSSFYTLFGNSSYSLVSPKMTWEEARKKCNSEKAELASILNPYVQSFLWLQVLRYREPVWIGLNSNMTGEQYKWISNQRVIYTAWAPEEPKQKIACVYLDLDGHWKTGACNETYFFVCEQHHGVTPTKAPELPGKCPASKEDQGAWIPFRAHCYQISPSQREWPDASFKCSQFAATLTSIEDLAEIEFLVEHIQQVDLGDFWIGLFRNIDGEWLWQDNTAVDFVNWQDEEPIANPLDVFHDNGHNCVYMNNHDGKWSRTHCSTYRGFICKKHKIIEETTKGPTKSTEQEDIPASAHGRVAKVVLPVIFILICVGVAVYIFYKRRSRQQYSTGSFDNSLYYDREIIIQNNDSDTLADDREGN